MLYHILLGVAIYIPVACALSWWLGGIFKRERACLGLPVEHLRAAEEWWASHKKVDMLETEVLARAAAAQRTA